MGERTDDYFDLGTRGRTVTTSSGEAQVWFDRGLNWSWSFNREEALRCFAKVVEADPACAMGYWGLAYATGPYYNGPWDRIPEQLRHDMVDRSNGHIKKARDHSAKCTEVERALINALFQRFPEAACNDQDIFDSWDDAYAEQMRQVYARFPADDEVCALTAEALICRTPWKLWDLEQRVPAEGADTAEALEIVETAVARIDDDGGAPHPGLLHFYVHILEMSPEPERALKASHRLQSLVPDAAHLIHMPSHIYILCGEYQRSLEANLEAVVADNKYVAEHNEIGIYTIYRLHNLHFQVYSALFLGRYDAALAAADAIAETVTPEALHHQNSFLVNYLEAFMGMKVHVYVRFGKWQEIIDEPMPDDPELLVVTTALWHYAKGVAYSATGDVENAAAEQLRLREAITRVPTERIVFNNECTEVLEVADAMLAGELEYRLENYDVAFDHLRRTVELYDRLNYSEPWSWMQPPRHALGTLLLEQGHVAEAVEVYRADLGLDDTLVRPSQHPDNVWALHGYLECCERLGDDEMSDQLTEQLVAAQARADITVTASCFCRQPVTTSN